jgi:flagellar assembly protein FliH
MAQTRSLFSFDRDLSQAAGVTYAEPARRVPVSHAEHVRLIEAARAEAYEAGIAEGRRLQADHETLRLAGALEQLSARLEIATIEMRRLEENARREAVEFALIFARKLAGRVLETIPVQAIEMTARAIFNDLRGAPHVAVRVAPDLVDECKSRLGALMRENGVESKLIVFPDPEVAIGDCRIEWADGGIVRERQKLEALVAHSAAILFPDRT